MDNQKVRQLVKDLNKKLDNWEWEKALIIVKMRLLQETS